jgi:ribosomal protein L12E/L44/L45/RPP1/RPP2
MSSGSVTISNAPRDAEKLQVIGPFMLKKLMEETSRKLGVDFNEDRRNAFLRDPIDKRAKDVLEMLLQIDKSEGGAPASAPAAAASAPAEAAPKAEKADKPPRQPKPGPQTNGTTNGSSSTPEDGMLVLQGIAGVIKEVSGSLEAMQKTLQSVEKGSKRLDKLEEIVEQSFKLQHLQMALLCQIAENQLGAGAATLLEGAIDEYASTEKVVTKLIGTTGK